MPYKPNFCCQCGVKIERVDWNLTTSRRFCDLCDTDLKFYDWLPRAVFIGGVFLAIFGFGSFWAKSAKTLNSVPLQVVGNSRNVIPETVKPVNANLQIVQEKSVSNQQPPTPQQNIAPKIKTVLSSPVQTPEVAYFCGAQTKKGTPCSRRVKGGGRCWQHSGQPAMLPPEKLVANR